ncbi:McrB family protein [Haliscomenobacter hydrossis]|nr:AAA family ATPase [Haliscomenobacter hydrossis]
MATLLIKFSNLNQYDASTATITYSDPDAKRWADVFSKLKPGDKGIFHANNLMLLGEYSHSVANKSIVFLNVKRVDLRLDDLLKINAMNPETLAIFKRPPGPILREHIDATAVFEEAEAKRFLSFYIVRAGHEAGIIPKLKQNDRVITVDAADKLTDLRLFDGNTLVAQTFGPEYFNAKGKSLADIMKIHGDTQQQNRKLSSNNLRSIERIAAALQQDSFYKFRSFSEYYNAVHNKKLYYRPTSPTSIESSQIAAEEELLKDEMKMQDPQNLILFGPPGTGKTYYSIPHAVALIEGADVEALKNEERELVKQRFDDYLTQGRIVFCTFHQSMSYEDFIEGIKPLVLDSEENSSLKYEVRDGLFKKLCTEAAFSIAQQLDQPKEGYIDSFDVLYDAFVSEVNEKLDRGEPIPLDSKNSTLLVNGISEFGNVSIKHREDTRTYTVSKRRLGKLHAAFPDLSQVSNIDKDFRSVIGGSNASAYWAVLNALRKRAPLPIEVAPTLDATAYSYESKKALIEQIPAIKFKEATGEPFVMIIDEINRGNIAQIFGELITLLEPDKRLGMAEGLRLTLPYSGDAFGVPHNLHIIGTMNTADRSVEALDTALRRRFSFIPTMPEIEKLKPTEDKIDLGKILHTLNTRLRILKDQDHTIGHAWLIGVKNLAELQTTFGNKILPLLQEYFYNDYEKLGLVLGDRFFNKPEQVSSNIFAQFSGGNDLAGQYNQAWQYELKRVDELTLEDFQSLESLTKPPKPNDSN